MTGEDNHSIPPALSDLLDHFLEEYFFRPSAIVCYSSGAFGGVRAAMQLRAMLCELGMPSISSLFPIPSIQSAFDEDGTPRDHAPIERRFARFPSELEWHAERFARLGSEACLTDRTEQAATVARRSDVPVQETAACFARARSDSLRTL